jgi:cbb3-type cytochrome oxidase subunit 3
MLAGDAQAAGAMLSWLGSALTTTFAICFAGWAWWAWRPKNRARMEAYAQIPFDDGER